MGMYHALPISEAQVRFFAQCCEASGILDAFTIACLQPLAMNNGAAPLWNLLKTVQNEIQMSILTIPQEFPLVPTETANFHTNITSHNVNERSL